MYNLSHRDQFLQGKLFRIVVFSYSAIFQYKIGFWVIVGQNPALFSAVPLFAVFADF
jgi:hypothetical protein